MIIIVIVQQEPIKVGVLGFASVVEAFQPYFRKTR